MTKKDWNTYSTYRDALKALSSIKIILVSEGYACKMIMKNRDENYLSLRFRKEGSDQEEYRTYFEGVMD